MDKIVIRVGSISEHKIGAARDACDALKIDAEVTGVQCSSGVPEQPFQTETLTGAKNRANQRFGFISDETCTSRDTKVHLRIGIENGVVTHPQDDRRWFDRACIVMFTAEGKRYESWSTAIEINGEDAVRAEHRGFDANTVASVTAERTGCDPNDATPYYTGGRVTRRELLAQAVKVVLAQWLADEERRVRAG